MNIKVIEKSKNKLLFEIEGETHTFCNILKEELWNDDSVVVSAYKKQHPLVGTPTMIVETKGKSAVDALKDAVNRIKKQNAKAKKAFLSAF